MKMVVMMSKLIVVQQAKRYDYFGVQVGRKLTKLSI